jgi:selenocysteine lyase/cysteine desulfurase
VRTPNYQHARIMHEFGGVCFIDFAASAPYEIMNMHPEDPMEKLDAVMFSPHKFLGGPGSSGVLIFDVSMYKNEVPDNPGGGTVDWTNRWGKYKYVDDIETREDGGTPGFLQSIKTALCFELKDQMGIENIKKREEELLELAFKGLDEIEGLNILADNVRDRLGVISFYIENIHYNLLVQILNDKYGIQTRGGCACAGTYGHFLLEVSYETSQEITDKINHGDLSDKPGWVRWSLHPTMTNDEVEIMISALKEIVANIETYKNDYVHVKRSNVFRHKNQNTDAEFMRGWFTV